MGLLKKRLEEFLGSNESYPTILFGHLYRLKFRMNVQFLINIFDVFAGGFSRDKKAIGYLIII